MVDIQSAAAEIRRGKKEEERRTNHSMKIYMVSLLHRATIKKQFTIKWDNLSHCKISRLVQGSPVGCTVQPPTAASAASLTRQVLVI